MQLGMQIICLGYLTLKSLSPLLHKLWNIQYCLNAKLVHNPHLWWNRLSKLKCAYLNNYCFGKLNPATSMLALNNGFIKISMDAKNEQTCVKIFTCMNVWTLKNLMNEKLWISRSLGRDQQIHCRVVLHLTPVKFNCILQCLIDLTFAIKSN